MVQRSAQRPGVSPVPPGELAFLRGDHHSLGVKPGSGREHLSCRAPLVPSQHRQVGIRAYQDSQPFGRFTVLGNRTMGRPQHSILGHEVNFSQ